MPICVVPFCSVVTNSSDTETTEGIELGRTGYKSRKVWGRIIGIHVEGVLKLNGEGVKMLGDKI